MNNVYRGDRREDDLGRPTLLGCKVGAGDIIGKRYLCLVNWGLGPGLWTSQAHILLTGLVSLTEVEERCKVTRERGNRGK